MTNLLKSVKRLNKKRNWLLSLVFLSIFIIIFIYNYLPLNRVEALIINSDISKYIITSSPDKTASSLIFSNPYSKNGIYSDIYIAATSSSQKMITEEINYAACLKNTFIKKKVNVTNNNIYKSDYSQDVPILMYHYIEKAPASSTLKGLYLDPKIFVSQLEEINKGGYQTVFISELANNLISGKAVIRNSIALTFDDAYEDFYTNVYPLLKKYKIKATLYVIINALDTPGYLSKDQLREVAGSEFVEIGSHTFNHPDLKKINNRQASFEIVESKKEIEKIINKPVLSFCYPFGIYQGYDEELAASAGYLSSLTTQTGVRHYKEDLQSLKRVRPGGRRAEIFSKWLQNLGKNMIN